MGDEAQGSRSNLESVENISRKIFSRQFSEIDTKIYQRCELWIELENRDAGLSPRSEPNEEQSKSFKTENIKFKSGINLA